MAVLTEEDNGGGEDSQVFNFGTISEWYSRGWVQLLGRNFSLILEKITSHVPHKTSVAIYQQPWWFLVITSLPNVKSYAYSETLAYGKTAVFGQDVFNAQGFECTHTYIRMSSRHWFGRPERLKTIIVVDLPYTYWLNSLYYICSQFW